MDSSPRHPPLKAQELSRIAAETLAHYEQRAAEFRDGTLGHDVSQNIAALLRHIKAAPPLTLLDFGCGPGRDLKSFAAMGHRAIGLEGASAFAAMAREFSGCEVWQQDFLDLELPAERFHGIFANASLFHIPSQELPRVLRQLHAALRPEGVLFSSNPMGTIRKAGIAGAMAPTMIAKDGCNTLRPPVSPSSNITTGLPGCRVNSSPGSRPLPGG